MKFLENHWASMTCGRSRTRIAGMSRESFPELPQMPAAMAEIPVKMLASMIARTIFAISMEESRFTLNGALLLLKSRWALDGGDRWPRLAMVEHPVELPGVSTPFRALVPRKAMGEIMKLAEESSADATLAFSGDDNHLFFQFGQRLLMSRKLTGNFPITSGCCPRIIRTLWPLDRDELRKSIERVSQFADERSRAIRVQVQEGEVAHSFVVVGNGRERRERPGEYDGPGMRSVSTPDTCWISCAASSEEQVTFRVQGSEQRRRTAAGADRGRRTGLQVSLRRDAHANLKIWRGT